MTQNYFTLSLLQTLSTKVILLREIMIQRRRRLLMDGTIEEIAVRVVTTRIVYITGGMMQLVRQVLTNPFRTAYHVNILAT